MFALSHPFVNIFDVSDISIGLLKYGAGGHCLNRRMGRKEERNASAATPDLLVSSEGTELYTFHYFDHFYIQQVFISHSIKNHA